MLLGVGVDAAAARYAPLFAPDKPNEFATQSDKKRRNPTDRVQP
jgi:hypothetical protein